MLQIPYTVDKRIIHPVSYKQVFTRPVLLAKSLFLNQIIMSSMPLRNNRVWVDALMPISEPFKQHMQGAMMCLMLNVYYLLFHARYIAYTWMHLHNLESMHIFHKMVQQCEEFINPRHVQSRFTY